MPSDVAAAVGSDELGADLFGVDEQVVDRRPRTEGEHRRVFEQQ